MLQPAPEALELEVRSGAQVYDIFGLQVEPPAKKAPEANGHRILFSPRAPRAEDTFLTLLQTHADNAEPLPYTFSQTQDHWVLRIADRIVCLPRDSQLVDRPVEIDVPQDGQDYQVLLAGLSAGEWRVTTGQRQDTHQVAADAHTLHFIASGGAHRVSPAGR